MEKQKLITHEVSFCKTRRAQTHFTVRNRIMFFVGRYTAFRWLIISLICALTFFALGTSGCRPEPFHSLVIVDKNVERTDFVNSVVQNFPNGSIFVKPISFKGTVSSASMDNEIYMKLDENRKMAEIVLVFVNTGTILNGEPEFSRKKKTFVVVFGSSVPETWKNVATDDNHWFQVTRDSNSSMISERLIKQLECDSKYYCDIDMYSRKKGQTCIPCSNLCGADPKQRSKSCSHYCPYFWLKSKEEELETSSNSTPTLVHSSSVKYTVIILGVVIVVLFGVLFPASIICYFIEKEKLVPCTISEGTAVPLTESHHETGTTQEDVQSQTSQRLQDDSQTTTNTDGCSVTKMKAGSSSEVDVGAGPSMPTLNIHRFKFRFKNRR